jgi:hypothetical protein
MFGIDHDPVETGACDDLRSNVAAKATPQPNLSLPAAQGGFEHIRR